MCDTCGCNITPGNKHLIQDGEQVQTVNGKETIKILTHLLSQNDQQAAHNREHFDQHHVLAINLMSSPGAGKTALLEATIKALSQEFTIGVIVGDLETENDAQRIRRHGVSAFQIVTGTACHLDAHLTHQALHHFNLAEIDILFIENVGNLVCPASFDLGHHRNVTLLSVTEGDDKPAKYPVMFRTTDLMLLTKTDLLPVLDDFDLQRAENYLRQLANPAPVMALSAKKGIGMNAWLDWLRQEVKHQQEKPEKTVQPHHHSHHRHHSHHHHP
jgi:hydrogenase nickel incorporation protein HypB